MPKGLGRPWECLFRLAASGGVIFFSYPGQFFLARSGGVIFLGPIFFSSLELAT